MRKSRTGGGLNSTSPEDIHARSRSRATTVVGRASTKDVSTVTYDKLIKEARRVYGWTSTRASIKNVKGLELPIEWENHVLMSFDGSDDERIIIFTPAFLRRSITADLDQNFDLAIKYILLQIDRYAMRAHGKYTFVLCLAGLEWITPEMVGQVREVGELLPKRYQKNLKAFYVLHPTKLFRASLWTLYNWFSTKMWERIEYVYDVAQLVKLLYPAQAESDLEQQAEVQRCLPFVVQRNDALVMGKTVPIVFGAPIKQLRKYHGVDITERSSGRMYEQLPVPLAVICEVLDNEELVDADKGVLEMFSGESTVVSQLLTAIDEGRPIERHVPASALWCALKVFLDCLPLPLLSFKALDDLMQANIRPDDEEAQRHVLIDLLTKQMAFEKAQVTLFLASFLHRRCAASLKRRVDKSAWILTPWQLAEVFAPVFLRPRDMSEEYVEVVPSVVSLVETLIISAEHPALWNGRVLGGSHTVVDDISDAGSQFSVVSDSESDGGDKKREPVPEHKVTFDDESHDTPESTRTPSLA